MMASICSDAEGSSADGVWFVFVVGLAFKDGRSQNQSAFGPIYTISVRKDAVGALEHHLVICPLGAAELGVVARVPNSAGTPCSARPG